MQKLDDIITTSNVSIKEVLKIIEDGVKQIALVVDKNKKLIGTVNDGDIRRAILNG